MNNEDIENDIFKVSGVSNVISKQKELFAANDNYFSSEEYKQQHLSYYQSLNSTEDDLVSYFNKNYLDSVKQNDLANIKKQKQSELLELSEYNSMSAWDKYSASVDANSLTYNIVMKAMDVKDYVTSNYDETYTIDSKLKDLSLYSNKNNRDGLSDLQIEEILHNARNKQHLQRLVTLEIMKNQNLASRRRMEKYGGTIGNLGYTMAGYITDPLNIIGSSFAYGVRFAKGSTKTKMAIGGA
ncbi:MAG: hypothetical protein U9N34_08530, partial [Candidatus Cloacimonadota bacterium]|nr:hypothetical protein [Candidatus Cloacimonadota bacterium]